MIVTSAFVTVVTGTTVYVLGQMVSKFVIDPVYEMRRKVLKTRDDVSFYSNIYTNWARPDAFPVDTVRSTSLALRQASMGLSAAVGAVLFYGLWVRIGLLPEKEKIRVAARDLIYLSNSHGLADEGPAIRTAAQRVEDHLVL